MARQLRPYNAHSHWMFCVTYEGFVSNDKLSSRHDILSCEDRIRIICDSTLKCLGGCTSLSFFSDLVLLFHAKPLIQFSPY